MSLYLYTENFSFLRRIKNVLRRAPGPAGVERSLLAGLKKLGVPFTLNSKQPAGLAGVLSGSNALRWAIEQKKMGKIQTIIAGPNITETPLDHNRLLENSVLDFLLVPSDWVKQWWVSLAPSLAGRIYSWAAGVEDRGDLRKSDGVAVILKKQVSEQVFSAVHEEVKKRGIKTVVLEYQSLLAHEDFIRLLAQTNFMIYLTYSESQGLTLTETWMANIPTLVYNQHKLHYKSFQWHDEKISAPYLTEAAGLFFEGPADFSAKLDELLARLETFTPREYALENFTDQIAAKKYLEITRLNHAS